MTPTAVYNTTPKQRQRAARKPYLDMAGVKDGDALLTRIAKHPDQKAVEKFLKSLRKEQQP